MNSHGSPNALPKVLRERQSPRLKGHDREMSMQFDLHVAANPQVIEGKETLEPPIQPPGQFGCSYACH